MSGSGRPSQAQYGSDFIVELLAGLGIPYVVLNPGASFRGIHDSLVNFDTPGKPKTVLCLHEEVAVAVAHGYARVTGRPLVAAVHNVVGLLHASMAIFNAWCDRVPMMVIGGTGPMAPEARRNWIEWVHTAQLQGNLVREYVKWDDQPFSLLGIADSVVKGHRIATAAPCAPVYLCFDAALQEAPMPPGQVLPDFAKFQAPAPIGAQPAALEEAARLLARAERPVMLVEGTGRHREALPYLTELAETLQAPVISVGTWFNLPTALPLNASARRNEALHDADVVLMLDLFDPSFTLQGVALRPEVRRIHISVWDLLERSLVTDSGPPYPTELPITADTRAALPALLDATLRVLAGDAGAQGRIERRQAWVSRLRPNGSESAGMKASGAPSVRDISTCLAEIVQGQGLPYSFVSGHHIGGPWEVGGWQLSEPDNLAAGARGAGVGQTPASAVGASLAYKDTDRLCINMVGDGELLYVPTSLWTAAHLRLPMLTIVNNNRSYGNDEAHQATVARHRGRPVENRGVAVRIEDPDVSVVDLARSFGMEALGPLDDVSRLRECLSQAVSVVARERRPMLVEVRTQQPSGAGR